VQYLVAQCGLDPVLLESVGGCFLMSAERLATMGAWKKRWALDLDNGDRRKVVHATIVGILKQNAFNAPEEIHRAGQYKVMPHIYVCTGIREVIQKR